MRKLTVLSLLILGSFVYAQTDHHEHRMSPQVHRCMKVMEDPKYMEEMMRYMLQNQKEMMKRMFEKNPDMKKMMEEVLK